MTMVGEGGASEPVIRTERISSGLPINANVAKESWARVEYWGLEFGGFFGVVWLLGRKTGQWDG